MNNERDIRWAISAGKKYALLWITWLYAFLSSYGASLPYPEISQTIHQDANFAGRINSRFDMPYISIIAAVLSRTAQNMILIPTSENECARETPQETLTIPPTASGMPMVQLT